MYVDDMDRAMSFIHEKEAGEFIAYLADHPCDSAVNGCSNGVIGISEIISYAEKITGKTAILDEAGDAAPYNGLTDTLSFNTEKARSIGYTFSDLGGWIYGLLDNCNIFSVLC